MDYQSAKPSDMQPCDLLKGKNEELGQTATFVFSDKHKWFWLDEQQTDEVTVIKIWDSKTDGTSRCMSAEQVNFAIDANNAQFVHTLHSVIQMLRRTVSLGRV